MRLTHWKPSIAASALVFVFAWLCLPGRIQARPLSIDVGGTIASNTTWSKANSPYVVTTSVYVADGVVLTIEPGVLVKFAQNTGLYVQGNGQLVAVGTAGEVIVFTSLRDDSQGGDTNGDGAATVPQPGDWYSLSSYGILSSLQLEHTLIRYASSVEANGHLRLHDSTIENNSGDSLYIYPNSGTAPTISVERTTLHTVDRHAISLYNHPGTTVSLRNNTIDVAGYGTGILLTNVVGAQIVENTIHVADDNEGARAIVLNGVGETLSLTNNTLTRAADSKAYAGIEVSNSRPQLTGNQVSGFAVAILLNGGYPEFSPVYAANDFSQNNYANSVAVTGEIRNGSWTSVGGYLHFVRLTVTIKDNATLTIPPGAVIKFSLYGGLRLGEKSQLRAQGTLTQTIVLTSLQDDTHGGDTNGDGGATIPTIGDWNGIESYGNLSLVDLTHVLIRFPYEAIDGRGHVKVSDSVMEKTSTGLYFYPNSGTAPNITVERTLLRDTSYGIYLIKVPATLKLTGNAFVRNDTYGLYNADTVLVDATGNWWDDTTGPQHETANPGGQGAWVGGPVNVANWLTVEPPFVPLEPVKPPANTPASSPDAYEPNDGCNQAGTLQVADAFQAHTFHAPADTDWLQFSATAGITYRVEVQTETDSLADVNLELYTQCAAAAAETWQATFTPAVRLDFQATQSGAVYLRLTNYDDKIYGSNVGYRVSVRPLKTTAELGAVIILAGRLKGADRLQTNIHFSTQNVYNLFKASGYTDDNIYYLATDESLGGWDAQATLANLQTAITSWATDKVSSERPLTLYLMDHGGVDTFYVDGANGQELTPGDLNSWLNQLEASVPGVRTTVIIEACHSGSFIDGEPSISKTGRLVITSTNVENVAFASNKGAQFSDRLFTSLREGYSLPNSFWDAQYSVRRLYKLQEPWIDANGNAIPNEPADGAEISQHNPSVDQSTGDTWAPYIVTAQGPDSITEGQGMLRAEVRDNKGVARVWAAIYAPSYQAPASVEELVAEDVPIIEFTPQGNNQFSAGYDKFIENGIYQIALYAEDNDGLKARLLVLPVKNGNADTIFLPLVID